MHRHTPPINQPTIIRTLLWQQSNHTLLLVASGMIISRGARAGCFWKVSLCFLAARNTFLSNQQRFGCVAFQTTAQKVVATTTQAKPNPQRQFTHRRDNNSLLLLQLRTFGTDTTMPKSKKKTSASTLSATNNGVGDAASPSSLGVMMILSPAKSLNLEPLSLSDDSNTNIPESSLWTSPDGSYRDQSRQVVQAMKKRSQAELGKLLSISANLAKTSHGVSMCFFLCFACVLSLFLSLRTSIVVSYAFEWVELDSTHAAVSIYLSHSRTYPSTVLERL